jgi:PKD repeat protein
VDGDYAGDEQTMDYSFETAGDYDVSLEVFDNGEKSDEITKTVTVTNSKPEAAFSYSPSSPVPDEEIRFDAGSSSDSDGEIVDYRWEVDGDYAGDEQTMDYSFETAGEYDVSLEVFDNGEKSDELRKTVTVTNNKPEAAFSYSPSSPVPDEEIRFDSGSSSDSDGEIVDYRWEVDGDYAGD